MSESLPFLKLVQNYWGQLGLKTMIRAQSALGLAENEQYTFEKLAIDMLGFYNDSIGIWITLAASPATSAPIPTLSIPRAAGTDNVFGTLPLGLAAGTVLQQSALFSGAALPVPKANVTPSVAAGGALRVDVTGLNALNPASGVYQGLVTAAGMPLPIAKIELHVN